MWGSASEDMTERHGLNSVGMICIVVRGDRLSVGVTTAVGDNIGKGNFGRPKMIHTCCLFLCGGTPASKCTSMPIGNAQISPNPKTPDLYFKILVCGQKQAPYLHFAAHGRR